jgi:hypothetical protein
MTMVCRQQSLLVGDIGRSIMALTLSEIEPALNADDQQWSSTISYVDLECFLRVDDDDVSTTATVRIHAVDRSTVALAIAGAAPLWNGNDERRPMLSITSTGNGSRAR